MAAVLLRVAFAIPTGEPCDKFTSGYVLFRRPTLPASLVLRSDRDREYDAALDGRSLLSGRCLAAEKTQDS